MGKKRVMIVSTTLKFRVPNLGSLSEASISHQLSLQSNENLNQTLKNQAGCPTTACLSSFKHCMMIV